MFKTLIEIYDYLVNDWKTSGWKIRMVARGHMLNAIVCELVYTWWVFGLPKNWHPDLQGQGPFIARHYRIFCFFIYNISLFINCGQFFNGLLLYGCVDQGIKEKEVTLETSKFYIMFSVGFIIVNIVKFCMLFLFLDYGLFFSALMSIPEVIGLFVGIIMIIHFKYELIKMDRIPDKATYTIAKNGKIIFEN